MKNLAITKVISTIIASLLITINPVFISPAPLNSFDGISWIKYADENGVITVIDVGSSGDLDYPWVLSMGAIRDDDVLTDSDPTNDDELYKMWYSGNSINQYYEFRIFYATSSDGRNWYKHVDGAGSAIPVIDLGGAPGGADDASAYSPSVIKENGLYKMWYGSQRSRTSSYRTSYATSIDGMSWTKYGEVLDVGAAGERDERDAYAPQVIIDDDAPSSERYKMWYMGQTQSGPLKIFYATSSDGINWIKYSDSNGAVPVLEPGGAPGGLDDSSVGHQCLVKDNDGLYRMWYNGASSIGQRILYAESVDGISWTKYGLSLDVGNSGELDSVNVGQPSVIAEADGTYKMWNHGHDGNHFRIFHAYSEQSENVPPVADAGPDQTVNEGDIVELDATNSIGSPIGKVNVLHVSVWQHDELQRIIDYTGSTNKFGVTQVGLSEFNTGNPSDFSSFDVIVFGLSNGFERNLEPIGRTAKLKDYVLNDGGIVWTHDSLEYTWDYGPDLEGPAGVDFDSSNNEFVGFNIPDVEILLDHDILHAPYEIGNVGDVIPKTAPPPPWSYYAHTSYGTAVSADIVIQHITTPGSTNFYLTTHEYGQGRVALDVIGHTVVSEDGEFLGLPSLKECQILVNAIYWVAGGGHTSDIISYEWDFTSDGTYDYVETPTSAPDGAFDGITTHVYGDDGTYTATLRITDENDQWDTDSCDITVNNVNPTISTFGPYSSNEGAQLNVQASASDFGSDDLTFTWDWGDGTSSATTTFCNNGLSPEPVYDSLTNEIKSPMGTYPFSATDSVSHTYGDDGVYTITLTVEDDDEGLAMYTTTVTVNNVAPSILLTITPSGVEGEELTFEAEAADSGTDDLTFTWDFEYGTTISNPHYINGVGPEPVYDPLTNNIKSPLGVLPFSAHDSVTHTYGDNYDYTLTLTVTDDDEGTTTYSTTITVDNLAPAITQINIPASIYEGSSAAFEAFAEDEGSDDLTFTWEFELGPSITNVYFNDGLNPDPSPSPWGDYPFDVTDTVEHTFGDNGNFYLVLTITDDDGGMTTYNTTIKVDNVAPSVDIIGALIVDENSPLDLEAHGTDPGSDDLTFTWDIDYGLTTTNLYYNNGISPDLYPSPEANPMDIMDYMTHTWGDNGVFLVILTVSDDDGGTTIIQVNITVDNVVPAVDSGGPYEIDENSPVSMTAKCNDVGSDDLTITWDWGDGFSSTIISTFYNDGSGLDPFPSPDINPMLATDSQTHTYGDNGIFSVTISVEDDDGGTTISFVNVTVNNVAPTILDFEVYMYANISLRVAGEKYHSVSIHLFEDGYEIWTASVTRYPGDPDEQKATISNVGLDMTKCYTALVDYLPNDPRENGNVWGGNPVWIDMEFEDGSTKRLHHTFNVRKSYWDSDHWNHMDPWEVDLNVNLVGASFKLTSHITDPGSDDLILTYTYGTQIKTITHLSNPLNPDPYPSPEINPRDIIATTSLTYEGSGILSLSVKDDDGGSTFETIVIS